VSDSATPDEYVALDPVLGAAIDLHGTRARRRHVAIAMMRALGYKTEPSYWTLIAFSWLADEIVDLLSERTISIEGKARACASRVAAGRDTTALEVDLGLVAQVEGDRLQTTARRVTIVDDLFPRVRRFLRTLADAGQLVDLD
jgi:hypothetical protein